MRLLRGKKKLNFICIQSHINNFQNLKTINLVIDEYTLSVHRFLCLCCRDDFFSSVYSSPRVRLAHRIKYSSKQKKKKSKPVIDSLFFFILIDCLFFSSSLFFFKQTNFRMIMGSKKNKKKSFQIICLQC